MASSPSSPVSEPAIIEQVITEFFAKSVHIILESRSPYVSSRNYSADPFVSSPSSSSSSSFRPRDKWFNLALREFPAALENFDLWRQSNLEPLVVDVILIDRRSVRTLSFPSPGGFLVRNLSSGRDEFGCDNRSEKIVERWIVQYESRSSRCIVRETSHRGGKKGNRTASRPSEFQVMYKKAYRRITVLFRSLYAAVRLLPAYKLFKDLNASGKIHPLSLSHRISSFTDPFSREDDGEMNQLGFGPLDTFFGRLSLSVTYLKKIDDICSEPSTPMSTQFIMDYVGSPLADPLKRFVSLPSTETAPSCASLSRRHSWSYDHGEIPSFSPTPSPTYSDSRALVHNLNPRLPPSRYLLGTSSPCSSPKVFSAGYTKNFDDYRPSPPFSQSSSPSPPPHVCKALMCSESAPVGIPLTGQNDLNGGTPSPHTFSSENKLQLKEDPLRLMELQTDTILPKIFSSGQDLPGNVTTVKLPSYIPPHIPSRSSSRLSFLDEFDDSGFTCPFAEDDEVTKLCRIESGDCINHDRENLGSGELIPVRRSSDAAVGALVWMLRTAPPLRLDISNTTKSLQVFKDETSSNKYLQEKKENSEEGNVGQVDRTPCLDNTASYPFKPRTAADALEEFRTYKGLRESILKHDGSLVQEIEDTAKSDPEEPTGE